jgi:hypothetical protein
MERSHQKRKANVPLDASRGRKDPPASLLLLTCQYKHGSLAFRSFFLFSFDIL